MTATNLSPVAATGGTAAWFSATSVLPSTSGALAPRQAPTSIQEFHEAAQRCLAGTRGQGLTPEQLQELTHLIATVSPAEVGFADDGLVQDPSRFEAVLRKQGHWFGQHHPFLRGHVTYVHIHSCADYSIGIFMLPKGRSIPLHDRPGMTVISHLLFGSLAALAMDFLPPTPRAPPLSCRGAGDETEQHQKQRQQGAAAAPQGAEAEGATHKMSLPPPAAAVLALHAAHHPHATAPCQTEASAAHAPSGSGSGSGLAPDPTSACSGSCFPPPLSVSSAAFTGVSSTSCSGGRSAPYRRAPAAAAPADGTAPISALMPRPLAVRAEDRGAVGRADADAASPVGYHSPLSSSPASSSGGTVTLAPSSCDDAHTSPSRVALAPPHHPPVLTNHHQDVSLRRHFDQVEEEQEDRPSAAGTRSTAVGARGVVEGKEWALRPGGSPARWPLHVE